MGACKILKNKKLNVVNACGVKMRVRGSVSGLISEIKFFENSYCFLPFRGVNAAVAGGLPVRQGSLSSIH